MKASVTSPSATGSRAVPSTQDVADAEADIAANGLTIDPGGTNAAELLPHHTQRHF